MDALYDWVCATKVTFIAGVVDKEQMEEKYTTPHHPSAVGYQIFLQRYQKFLKTRACLGAVLIDEPSGKSKAGNEWELLLERQHAKLKKHSCNYTRLKFTNLEDSIAFADSACFHSARASSRIAGRAFTIPVFRHFP